MAASGAWEALRPALQDALIRWTPKATLDFSALIEEPTPASGYVHLRFPVLTVRGEHAHAHTRLIVEKLPLLLPDTHLEVTRAPRTWARSRTRRRLMR